MLETEERAAGSEWDQPESTKPWVITPRTHVLRSMANQRISLTTALSELIDNSLDADAKHITFVRGEAKFSMTDDGCGVETLQEMARLGGSEKPPTEVPRIGRFGVGFKESSVFFSPRSEVRTWRGSVERRFKIDWDEIDASEVWEFAPPVRVVANRPSPSGTQIIFEMPVNRIRRLNDVYENLEFRYSPALVGGCRIKFQQDGQGRPRELRPFVWPDLKAQIDESVAVGDRRIHVRGGVVADGVPNPYSGVHLVFRRKVIKIGSALGCGSAVTARLFLWAELDGDAWAVSKHKNDVSQDHEEEISQALLPVLADIVQLADQSAMTARLPIFERALNDYLRAVLDDAEEESDEEGETPLPEGKREERHPGTTKGTVVPTGTGGKRTRASSVSDHPGSVESLKKLIRGGIRIVVGATPAAYPTVEVQMDARQVKLNELNPTIQRLLKAGSEGHMYGIGMMVIAAVATKLEPDQLNILEIASDPTQRLSELIAGWFPYMTKNWSKVKQV